MMRDPSLDIAGYIQTGKDNLAHRSSTLYAELHGYYLYCWTEKPRSPDVCPFVVYDIKGCTVTEPEDAKLDLVVGGASLANGEVVLTFAAEREKREWLAKLSNPVKGHSKTLTVVPRAAAGNESDALGSALMDRQKISLNDFSLIRVLGEGAYGRVVEAKKDDSSVHYAIKIMSKRLMEENAVTNQLLERTILAEIRHPFIVTLRYAFQTDEDLYIVMDLLSGGELFHHLEEVGTFDEHHAGFYTAEIGLAIGYLHEKNIIYRDLKPENVVLDKDGHACLTDFGLAKANMAANATAETFCGTPEYQAPEFLLGNPHNHAVDWWSLGIMFYEMLFGIPPFYDENNTVMSDLILAAPLDFTKNGRSASPAAQDLIHRLLERDVKRRMQTVEEFKRHPFFTNLDFDKLYRHEVPPPFRPSTETIDNFSTEFTQQAVPTEKPQGGDTHPNVAGFTYRGDEEPEVAIPATPPVPAPPAPAKSSHASHSSHPPTSPTATTTAAATVPATAPGKASATTSPKAKPASPTGKKGGTALPPPHLVTKVPPKRPSSGPKS